VEGVPFGTELFKAAIGLKITNVNYRISQKKINPNSFEYVKPIKGS
jgi:hypothetical protein